LRINLKGNENRKCIFKIEGDENENVFVKGNENMKWYELVALVYLEE